MMKNNLLKKALANQSTSIGSWVTIGNASIIEIMAKADFDWLTIDMEHTSIDFNEGESLIRTIQAHDIPALVRVGKNEELGIKRVLDAGADGIIIPMVNTKQDAIKGLNYCYYPPKGSRGVGLNRAQGYGLNAGFKDYIDWQTEDLVVIIQIEHINGVKNIDEILSIEGIDGVIIGPYDLSSSLGYAGQFDHPEVLEAIAKVKLACKTRKVSLGFHVIDPDYEKAKLKLEQGYNFIALSTDFLFLGTKAINEMTYLRNYY